MACPQDDMAFWPARLWPTPLSSLQLGVIPVIWTTGSMPNPAGGDPDPWLGRRVPDRLEWIGNSVELTYSSGYYERGLCLIALPKIRVLVQGFCMWGVNNLTITVNAGNRQYFHHMKAMHGNDGTFNGIPLFTSQCDRKYADETRMFQINIATIDRWLRLCAEYCLDSRGTPGPWWLEVRNLKPGDRFRPCSGCEYGFLETAKGRQPDTWDSLQLDAFLPRTFPLKRNQGMVRVDLGCPGNHALVVDTNTGDADKYMKLPLNCEDEQGYARSELFISEECFLPEEPDDFPTPEDPRWVPEPIIDSCFAEIEEYYPATNPYADIPVDGKYPHHVIRNVPREREILSHNFYTSRMTSPNYQVNERVLKMYKYHTKYTQQPDGTYLAERSLEVMEIGRMHCFLDFTSAETFWNDTNAKCIVKQNAWSEAIRVLRGNLNCNSTFQFYDGPPTPIPKEYPREERMDLDGDCYVKGDIVIGIKYNIEFQRVFKQLGPEVQDWAIRKLVPRFIPTAIKIPFTFRLPQGSTKIGGTTVTLTGTFVQVGVGNESIVINIEEMFAYYNLLDDSTLLGMLIPGPVSISNLESFCNL